MRYILFILAIVVLLLVARISCAGGDNAVNPVTPASEPEAAVDAPTTESPKDEEGTFGDEFGPSMFPPGSEF